MAGKSLTIVGAGPSQSVIQPQGSFRVMQIVGTAGASVSVVLESLSVRGGTAVDGGVLGGGGARRRAADRWR